MQMAADGPRATNDTQKKGIVMSEQESKKSRINWVLVSKAGLLVVAALAGELVGYTRGVADGRAREQAAHATQESARSAPVAVTNLPPVARPSIAPEVRAGIVQMLTQMVPAQYSALSTGDDADGAPPSTTYGSCRATHGSAEVFIITGAHVRLKAHRQAGAWVVDNADLGVDTPPELARTAIKDCVDAAVTKEASKETNRAAWVLAASATAVPDVPFAFAPKVDPHVRGGLVQLLAQIVPPQYSTLSMSAGPLVYGSCEAMHDGHLVGTVVRGQRVRIEAHRQDGHWIIDRSDLDADRSPVVARAQIKKCVDAIVAMDGFQTGNHTQWAQLARSAH